MELSDFKEALPIQDVWRSVITISGELCVMTFGAMLMPRLPADSWDFLLLVKR